MSQQKPTEIHMTNEERWQVALKMTSRASTGFGFLEKYLRENQNTDPAYLRSLYILFSFYFELLLKSRLVMTIPSSNPEPELEGVRHNFEKIKNLFARNLQEVGIFDIQKKTSQYQEVIYSFKTEYGDFCIKDFTDIRYDFFEGRGAVEVPQNEHELLFGVVEIGFKILGKIKDLNQISRALPG